MSVNKDREVTVDLSGDEYPQYQSGEFIEEEGVYKQ